LDTVATDIIEMKNLSLNYFHGSYQDYLLHCGEMTARKANLADARIRKESHIQKTIDAAHARGDDKTAKSKQKKLERASMTRNIDGHRFKNFSASKLVRKLQIAWLLIKSYSFFLI
jgi:ATPase subunit of ABC transporter with duplicated ATPase domains